MIRTTKGAVGRYGQLGYLKSGVRWTSVRFSSGDAAGYGPTAPKDASLLDPVVGRRASRGMHFSKVIAAQTIGCIRLPDQVTPPRIDLLILFQLADGESQSRRQASRQQGEVDHDESVRFGRLAFHDSA